MAADVIAVPERGEVGLFEKEFADELGEVRGVGVGAGQGAQAGTQPRMGFRAAVTFPLTNRCLLGIAEESGPCRTWC